MTSMPVAMVLAAAVAALPGMAFEFEWESRDGGAVTDKDEDGVGVELTRTGKYRFVNDPDEATRWEYFYDAINQGQVSSVRLVERRPAASALCAVRKAAMSAL